MVTVDELRRWEETGATWRVVELSGERTVIELCTCYGEAVDTVQGEGSEMVEFARAHRED